MGFSEYFIHSLEPTSQTDLSNLKGKEEVHNDFRRLPDQEILDGTEEIYFQENANCSEYEIRVLY